MATNPSPDPKSNLWNLTAFYLRLYRQKRGLSGEAVGRIMSCSKATVSRIEIGETRLDGTQAKALDRAWDMDGLFSMLVWYAALGHDPQWFAQYVDLEQRAQFLKIFEAQTIPGLLQTEDYARALFITGDAPNAEDLIRERMARQQLLDQEPQPFMSVLLSQTVLEWPIGSPEIMRGQLARLLELSERTRVTIQVIPRTWETGAYPGLDGSFELLSGDQFGDVAYTESPEGGRLVSSPSEVRRFAIRYHRINAKALPEEPSRALIRKFMEDTT
ncbi:hypothetical protein DPM19_13820 [Actinomadura craniellae]|uniref:HTH cro/C1-type domain-containing protein n=1 Tax=Actinomadura craniellae TaxID=2231787 RepID=A0A365H6Q4_9ACTN|nr:helix-turn-helix transcriptional regulator [Actinomadura craniellae]RAY14804.1 hypothetical protein DPM19_13820 [Actinomadura craniellae]